MGEMRVLTAQLHEVYRKHNVRLGRVFYAFLQVPIFISLFFATKEVRRSGDRSCGLAGGVPGVILLRGPCRRRSFSGCGKF